MLECLSETGYGRPIDLGYAKTVGQRGRHAQISNKARTVVRVNQTRIMQGRANKEKKPMTKEEICVGVDVAKITLDVAVSDSGEIRQFANDDEGISQKLAELWIDVYTTVSTFSLSEESRSTRNSTLCWRSSSLPGSLLTRLVLSLRSWRRRRYIVQSQRYFSFDFSI